MAVGDEDRHARATYDWLHAKLAKVADGIEDGSMSQEDASEIAGIQMRLKTLAGRSGLPPTLRQEINLDRRFIRDVILDSRPNQPPPKPKRTLAMKLRYVLGR